MNTQRSSITGLDFEMTHQANKFAGLLMDHRPALDVWIDDDDDDADYETPTRRPDPTRQRLTGAEKLTLIERERERKEPEVVRPTGDLKRPPLWRHHVAVIRCESSSLLWRSLLLVQLVLYISVEFHPVPAPNWEPVPKLVPNGVGRVERWLLARDSHCFCVLIWIDIEPNVSYSSSILFIFLKIDRFLIHSFKEDNPLAFYFLFLVFSCLSKHLNTSLADVIALFFRLLFYIRANSSALIG